MGRSCPGCGPEGPICSRGARWRCCAKGRARADEMPKTPWTLPIGARPQHSGVYFRVWAANARHVEVVLYDGEHETGVFALAPEQGGYFAGQVAGIGPGERYMYRLDAGDPHPDPVSRFQPGGVHSASQVV